MRDLKGVLFDMDGVLVDSEPVITEAAILTLKEYGITPKEEDFKEFTGTGDERFIGGVAAKYGVEYKPEMVVRAYDIYEEIAAEKIKVFLGVRDVVESLKKQGYRVAVCSSSQRRKVLINLKAAGLSEDDFVAIVTGSDITNKKPDPEIFLRGAEKIGVPPSQCFVVEDALSGVKAAKAAKCVCIAVTTSFSQKELKDAGADKVVNKLVDILYYIP